MLSTQVPAAVETIFIAALDMGRRIRRGTLSRAQSVPKRPETGSWRNAAKRPVDWTFSLLLGHFPPRSDTPRPSRRVHS